MSDTVIDAVLCSTYGSKVIILVNIIATQALPKQDFALLDLK